MAFKDAADLLIVSGAVAHQATDDLFVQPSTPKMDGKIKKYSKPFGKERCHAGHLEMFGIKFDFWHHNMKATISIRYDEKAIDRAHWWVLHIVEDVKRLLI